MSGLGASLPDLVPLVGEMVHLPHCQCDRLMGGGTRACRCDQTPTSDHRLSSETSTPSNVALRNMIETLCQSSTAFRALREQKQLADERAEPVIQDSSFHIRFRPIMPSGM